MNGQERALLEAIIPYSHKKLVKRIQKDKSQLALRFFNNCSCCLTTNEMNSEAEKTASKSVKVYSYLEEERKRTSTQTPYLFDAAVEYKRERSCSKSRDCVL
jgi:hypothetical protein